MLKLCKKCGKEKELFLFRFRNDRNSYVSHCKECEHNYNIKRKNSYKPLTEEQKIKRNIRDKKRYHRDLSFRLHKVISTSISKKIKKTSGVSIYLDGFGYSIDELIYKIESKFSNGMSWDNYGDWHIDHIKPRSLFNFGKKEEIIKCWSLNNLQPLWAVDNIRKSNNYREVV